MRSAKRELLTPEMARQLLLCTSNRQISSSHVQKYADAMLSGTWLQRQEQEAEGSADADQIDFDRPST